MVDEWKVVLDEGSFTGAVFMDLSKAFDCPPYSLLVAKCHAYRHTMPACHYLSQCKQCRKIGSIRSSDLHKGVPQGFIFGSIAVQYIHKWFVLVYWEMQSLQLRRWQYCFIFSPVLIWCVIKPAVWLQPCQWLTNNGMNANPNKF